MVKLLMGKEDTHMKSTSPASPPPQSEMFGEGSESFEESFLKGGETPWKPDPPPPLTYQEGLKVEVDKLDPQFELNVAADLLLNQLIPSVATFARELADIQLRIPRWQLVVGSVLAQYQSGTLAAPSIDPSWINDRPIVVSSRCEECGVFFEPTKHGQRFCTNVCGTTWNKRERERMKSQSHPPNVNV